MDTFSNNPLKKFKFGLLNLAFMVMVAALISACNNDDDGPTDPGNNVGSIAEIAQANDDFSDLVSALQDAGLVSTLNGSGPYTVFAPTNDAFANLPDGLLGSLSSDQLVEILSYHVVSGNISSGDLSAEQSVAALAGGDLFITAANGNVSVNDNAAVVNADIEASNGVIHAIDQVILPDGYLDVVGIIAKRYGLQSLEDAVVGAGLASTLQGDGPFTVFAPSNEAFSNVDLSGLSEQEIQDILTYHVIPSKVLSGDLQPVQTVSTVNGEDLTIEAADGTVTITDNSGQTYSVTQADLEGINGVVHVIDGVLNPAPNIIDVATDAGSFTTLLSALDQTGLTSALEGAGPFTVFAPTDAAFSGVDLSGLTNEQLAEILQYHVVSGEIASGDLSAQQAVASLTGDSLYVTADGSVVVNDAAAVATADIGASNGIIHAIDGVLLPDKYQDVVGIISKRYNLETLENAVVDAGLASTLQGDGPFTVFAPDEAAFEGVDLSGLTTQQLADILKYHVIAQEITSETISSGTVTTVNGATLDVNVAGDGTVTLTDQAGNTAAVTTVDLQGTNGVVHIIDGVLSPTQ